MIAGFLGLLLGRARLGILPFSDQLGTYASVLIAVIVRLPGLGEDPYAHVGRVHGRDSRRTRSRCTRCRSRRDGAGVRAVHYRSSAPPTASRLLLFAGWAGGFSSAAAIGSVLGDAGWASASSLAFTSRHGQDALAGIVSGIAK
ncbi:hypothetical protein HBB16_03125 [Pseudonocardia sp. MCCB 268]|nr:hypothetical protein [Pseudonocardia cytotoxica]